MQALRQSQKPLCLRPQAHEEGAASTEQVSKDDEVKSPCRSVTLLRHAIEGRRQEMLVE
jgi:hypothetical protein